MNAPTRIGSAARTLAGLLSLALLTFAVGCASFGITPAAREDGREGRDYVMLVRAWDKNADALNVTFKYRVNGGPWQEIKGSRNGGLFEARVPGTELPAGTLEYYAVMKNSKGEDVSSSTARVRILSFAEAKAKATAEYAARLSDGGTPTEFIYNEPAEFRLKVSGAPAPADLYCEVQTGGTTARLTPIAAGSVYSAALPAPIKGNSLAWRWTARWNDAEFGDITVNYPTDPKSVPVLDQAALAARVKQDFGAALVHAGPVSGTWLAPPTVRAELRYPSLLDRLSRGPRRVEMVLRRGNAVRIVPMNDAGKGVYTAGIPVEELEAGTVTYSFRYADTFANLGMIEAVYPLDKIFTVGYRAKAELAKDRIAELQKAFVHTPPADALEGQPVTFTVRVTDPKLQVKSLAFAGGSTAFGRGLPFVNEGDSWSAALPASLAKPGTWTYTMRAVVVDSRFGDLEISLPGGDTAWAVPIGSLAELRARKEAELAMTLSHGKPEGYPKGKGFALNLSAQGATAGDAASLYYRTSGATAYREAKGVAIANGFAFTLDAATASAEFIQYYFVLRRTDPLAGNLSATLRDGSGGSLNDFVIAAVAGAVNTTPPAPPVTVTPTTPATPAPTVPATPGTVTATNDGTKDVESYFSGPTGDKGGIRFFVVLKNELGLYDVSVYVKVAGKDSSFKEYAMDRKGKEYSYTLDTASLAAGTAVDFYYGLKKKGSDGVQLLNDKGQPFRATTVEGNSAASKTPGNSGKKN